MNFIKFKPKNKVFLVRTKVGHEVIATEDHPFLTPYGMRELKELKEGKKTFLVFFNQNAITSNLIHILFL